jgi:hypothetical protein
MGYMGCKSNALLLVPGKKTRTIFPHVLWLGFLAMMVHTGSARKDKVIKKQEGTCFCMPFVHSHGLIVFCL